MTIQLPPRVPRKIVETDIVRAILVAVNRIPGVRAARNNVGMIEDCRGIPVTFGLGEGSPDIVGVVSFGGAESTRVLPELAPIAIAIGIEVKRPGRYASRKQKAWHTVAARRGMLTTVARSGEEAAAWVNDQRAELASRIVAIGEALA